ncbi:hypothetical protein F511_35233 [Dorcoceras hygrometricum]|uniref:Uncharacterized protein n=1 Tax=Dorcoceras hygrometricum TaxID=472368 RepID=A0A2Z7B8G2_9LAMI|nr:hypothetical protein F511_35233 [Dorcoceras hygrometricum]
MVGGGNRKDDGPFIGNNTNVFAALDNLRRKKKSDKGKDSSKDATKSKFKEVSDEKPQVFWAPSPLTVKSWADVEDEEDDDYYATTAPPQAFFGDSGLNKVKESVTPEPVEESESEDELFDEGDDEMEDDHDHQEEVQNQPEPVMQKPVEVPLSPKETERQLSKKERRKKELAELDAILADFGVNTKQKSEEESSDGNKQTKEGELSGDAEAKGPAPSVSKTSKRKKKKDKVSKDEKESQDLPKCPEVPDSQEQEETAEAVQLVEDASAVDVKERLKKVLSKKKKSGKEMDAATRTASMEAAARSARLAAAKKKEKNHFNQQPTR